MMKRLLILIISLAALIGMGLATSAARAKEGLQGEMRWRWEGFDNWDFNSDVDDGWGLSAMRTRIGYQGELGERGFYEFTAENLHIFGDTRYEIEPGASFDFTPPGEDDRIYVHEAYLGLDDFLFDGFTARAGRFSLSYGRERFIGPDDWSLWRENRFDGFTGHYGFEAGWLDLLCLVLDETEQQKYVTGNGDVDMRGVYLHYDASDMFFAEPYVFWLSRSHEAYPVAPGMTVVEGPEVVALDSDNGFVYGALLDYMNDSGLHLYAEGQLQAGTVHETMVDVVGEDSVSVSLRNADLAGLGFYAGAFYEVDNELEPFIGVEFNYASGRAADDQPEDLKTFLNPFGSWSDYMGRANRVMWSNTASFRFSGGVTPVEQLDLKVDFYLFKSAEALSYVNDKGETETTKDLGTEVDVIASYFLDEWIRFEAGAAVFSADNGYDAYRDELAADLLGARPGPGVDMSDTDALWYGWLGAKVRF
jgi:hypothetical protein